jgi:hypothetical protein
MRNIDKIYKLRNLINDYEYEVGVLDDMETSWNEYDDPGSDPGLQFEQSNKIEDSWNEIVEFCKEL